MEGCDFRRLKAAVRIGPGRVKSSRSMYRRSRPMAGVGGTKMTASKRPVRYSHSRNGNHTQSDPLASIAERGQRSVLCDRNYLDSNDLRNV